VTAHSDALIAQTLSVYAVFDVAHNVVDHVKRDALYRALVDSIKNAIPGDKLDQRLADLELNSDGGCE
jgi:hypothetical protein